MTISKEDRAHFRFLSAQRSKGEWYWECRGVNPDAWTLFSPSDMTFEFLGQQHEGHPYNLLNTNANAWDANGAHNRAIIVASVNALPSLLDDLEAVESERDQLANMLAAAEEELAVLRPLAKFSIDITEWSGASGNWPPRRVQEAVTAFQAWKEKQK